MERLTGGTNTAVPQGDNLKRPGGGSKPSNHGGIKVEKASAPMNAAGHVASKQYGATEKSGIISTLDRKDPFSNPKNGKYC